MPLGALAGGSVPGGYVGSAMSFCPDIDRFGKPGLLPA